MKQRDERGGKVCGDLQLDSRGGPGFRCSLEPGHRGRHEARIGKELLDSWPKIGLLPKWAQPRSVSA